MYTVQCTALDVHYGRFSSSVCVELAQGRSVNYWERVVDRMSYVVCRMYGIRSTVRMSYTIRLLGDVIRTDYANEKVLDDCSCPRPPKGHL